ncbi:hypothetical protein QJQ45_018298, partial [Haematococcus lacustris]
PSLVSSPPPDQQLQQLLGGARADWPRLGRPDATGAMVGGSCALKLCHLPQLLPSLPAVLARGPAALTAAATPQGPGQGGQHQGLGQGRGGLPGDAGLGAVTVVSLQGPVVALGTALGVTLVAQLPSIAASAASAAAGAAAAPLPSSAPLPLPAAPCPDPAFARGLAAADASLMLLGEVKSEAEGVTSLAFSHVAAAGDPMWLAVGHASGGVTVWDLQRRPARLITHISGQHNLPVTHLSFLPGRATQQLLTCDKRGRLVAHSLNTNLLLLRTSTASKPLLDGGLGVISSIEHLTPFSVTLPSPPLGLVDKGRGGRSGGGAAGEGGIGPAAAAAPPTPPPAPTPPGSVVVGEGVMT